MIGTFDLKIGFKCNNNCRHCVVADKRPTKDLPLEEICSIIESISPENYAIQITGGEPTIYSYLPDVLEACKRRGLITVLQTNGTGFSDIEFLRKCAPNLDQVHIAIHSCIPEIHDTIVQSPGMWSKTIQGLDNLISEKVYFTTQTVLSKYNIDSLYGTFCFIQNKKPGTRMSMTYPHLMGNAYHNREDVAFRYSDYKEVFQKTLEKFHDVIFTEAIPYCYLHPYGAIVDSQEKDLITPDFSRVGIDKSSKECFKDYNILNIEDHRKAPLCKKCIYNDYCIGVWKEYIELFKNKLDLYPVTIEE
jgi:MoaA/NifB/PqqE/SkfB family radical SAM enzyme